MKVTYYMGLSFFFLFSFFFVHFIGPVFTFTNHTSFHSHFRYAQTAFNSFLLIDHPIYWLIDLFFPSFTKFGQRFFLSIYVHLLRDLLFFFLFRQSFRDIVFGICANFCIYCFLLHYFFLLLVVCLQNV